MVITGRESEGINWLQPAQNKIQWRVLTNTTMNIQVLWKRRGISWPSEETRASEQGLRTDWLVRTTEIHWLWPRSISVASTILTYTTRLKETKVDDYGSDRKQSCNNDPLKVRDNYLLLTRKCCWALPIVSVTFTITRRNKKFWEELITYVLVSSVFEYFWYLIRHGPHRKDRVQ
jgi:hypothetical protein